MKNYVLYVTDKDEKRYTYRFSSRERAISEYMIQNRLQQIEGDPKHAELVEITKIPEGTFVDSLLFF